VLPFIQGFVPGALGGTVGIDKETSLLFCSDVVTGRSILLKEDKDAILYGPVEGEEVVVDGGGEVETSLRSNQSRNQTLP
jgi:hypothetical protein